MNELTKEQIQAVIGQVVDVKAETLFDLEEIKKRTFVRAYEYARGRGFVVMELCNISRNQFENLRNKYIKNK